MMVDSLIWTQYINVTDAQHKFDRHTDSHVSIANDALCTGIGQQKVRILTICLTGVVVMRSAQTG